MGNCTKSILYGTIITGITLMLIFSATVNLQQASAKPPNACTPWPECNKKGGGNGDDDLNGSIDLIVCDDKTSIAKWRDGAGLQSMVTYNITANLPGLKNNVVPAVQAGVLEWEITAGADPASPYGLMEVPGNADVSIRLVKTIAPGTILGFADVDCPGPGGIQGVEIVLGIKGLKVNGIRNLAAHEFGHALGDGHSDRNDDLMGPSLDQTERKNLLCISNLDIEALVHTTTPYQVDDWAKLSCPQI